MPAMQVTDAPPIQVSPPRRARRARGRRGPGRALAGDVAIGCEPRAISHCARLALRLPVTGSSAMPLLPGRRRAPRRRSRRRRPASPPRPPCRADRPRRRPGRRARCGIGLQRQHLVRGRQHHTAPVGPLSHQAWPTMSLRARPSRARSAPRPPRAAALLRKGGAAKARRSPSRWSLTRPTAHSCTTYFAARLAAGLQPGVAAAQRRVAREGQLAAGREDAHAVVGRRPAWAAAGRWFRTGWSSW